MKLALLMFSLIICITPNLSFSDEIIVKEKTTELNVYSGTFDIIDKEGDDQASLVGIEHKNQNLFRDTIFGKFQPITGGFVTGDNATYVYTGVEAQYKIGRLNIFPSFTPGYYEKGDGKDLGSPLEFKSEIKFGFELGKNSKLGYSYNHISNNDWGDINPGSNNEHFSFSHKF